MEVAREILRRRAATAGSALVLKLAELEVSETSSREKLLDAKLRHAANRFGLALVLYLDEKGGFREDQPRWPKGSGETSGRWSGGAGASEPRTSQEYTGSSSRGHHIVPVKVFNRAEFNLSAEAREVFNRGVTGRLPSENHGWSAEHRVYNQAVSERLTAFLRERAIEGSRMTAAQASEFLNLIKRSPDARIRDFNLRIYRRLLIYWIRMSPRGSE